MMSNSSWKEWLSRWGKVENTWGKAKDAVHNANKEDSAEPEPHV